MCFELCEWVWRNHSGILWARCAAPPWQKEICLLSQVKVVGVMISPFLYLQQPIEDSEHWNDVTSRKATYHDIECWGNFRLSVRNTGLTWAPDLLSFPFLLPHRIECFGWSCHRHIKRRDWSFCTVRGWGNLSCVRSNTLRRCANPRGRIVWYGSLYRFLVHQNKYSGRTLVYNAYGARPSVTFITYMSRLGHRRNGVAFLISLKIPYSGYIHKVLRPRNISLDHVFQVW